MATMASGSYTIVVARPSRNGSPRKVSAGPRTAVRRGDAACALVVNVFDGVAFSGPQEFHILV